MQKKVLTFALLGLAFVAAMSFQARGGLDGRGVQFAFSALIGGLAGFALYHAAFGFTAAWRRMTRERRGAGLRAQMLLIGLTCLITFPLMTFGREIGIPAAGNILPMSVASAVGAFVFGIGMQLGGGCASGTLFTTGGGSTRMVVVLFFFITGSVVATAHYDTWNAWPRVFHGTSLIKELGLGGAMIMMAAALAAIWIASALIERRAHGSLEPIRPTVSILRGRWSLALGAIALAVVGIATMVNSGRPWGVTWGFALWGAHGAEVLGINVADWSYWQGWRGKALEQGVFGVTTSVMNLGIVFGAMAAAALAGAFAPSLKLSRRDLITAVIGGLMMGYGARMAYGCNIGAYLGGLISGSLHGWWWLIWGFAGSLIGTRLRGFLAMDPPLATRPATP
jgi:uncharacterized membrane protein YedE/YeeE